MSSTRRRNKTYVVNILSILSILSLPTTTDAQKMVALPPQRREARSTISKRGLTYSGCYSSSNGLSDQGSYTYQTSSYCDPICTGQNQAVLGLSGGSDCWCGNSLPPADSKVDDSNCNTPCSGYGSDMCGGSNYWSVYLTGSGSLSGGSSSPSPSSSSSSSSSSDSSSPSPSSSSSTSTAPNVVTSVAPGKTVVITAPAAQVSTDPSAVPTDSPSGGKTNVAGIAAGVVVGVVLVIAGIVALVFWLKQKRRKDAETEFKRSNQVTEFMRGGRESKFPRSGYSNMSDQRLDPGAGARRNSVGSIADNQDYSRKILRVANPDHS